MGRQSQRNAYQEVLFATTGNRAAKDSGPDNVDIGTGRQVSGPIDPIEAEGTNWTCGVIQSEHTLAPRENLKRLAVHGPKNSIGIAGIAPEQP